MSAERRLVPRTAGEFRIRLDGPHGRQHLVARDVSQGGVFVEVTRAYALGQLLEVRLQLPIAGKDEWIEMNAEVRHHTNGYHTEDGKGPYRGIGLRFVRMDAGEQARLNQYLATRHGSG